MQEEGLFRGLAEPRTLIINAIDEEAQLSAVARRSVPLDATDGAYRNGAGDGAGGRGVTCCKAVSWYPHPDVREWRGPPCCPRGAQMRGRRVSQVSEWQPVAVMQE